MEHKAYVFNYKSFENELMPILANCLKNGDIELLRSFIAAHKDSVTDPYEGEELPSNWEDALENRDVHEYGDYALTRYYDPSEDIGLGERWLQLDDRLQTLALGTPLGEAILFDPGRMGSYFQSPDQIAEALRLAQAIQPALPGVADLANLLRSGRAKGLYVTF